MQIVKVMQQDTRGVRVRRLHVNVIREGARLGEQRKEHNERALRANLVNVHAVRKWETERKEALRGERQFAHVFGAKQLSVGTSLPTSPLQRVWPEQ